MTTKAVTVVAVGTPVRFQNNLARPVVIPAGAQVGNLLVIVGSSDTGTVFTKTGMTGWTAVPAGQIINTTFQGLIAYYKFCSLGDAGASVSVGNYAANTKGGAVCIALDGVDPVTPFSVNVASTISNTLGTTHAIPTPTPDVNSTPLLVCTDRASATVPVTPSGGVTWPSGYTEQLVYQPSTDLNSGEEGLFVAIGPEAVAGSAIPGGNVVANSLSHFIGAILLVREYVPPAAAQIQIQDDAGWHTADLVGVGEVGVIKAVTLVDYLSGLHTPQLATDFADGTLPNPPWTFTPGATVDPAAADPNGTSGYGVHLAAAATSPFAASLTKNATTDPQGHAWASLRMRWKNVTLPGSGTYVNLVEIANAIGSAPKNQFTLYWNNGVLYADFNTEDAINLGFAADTNWHTLEARVYFGATTYTANIRLDGGTPIAMTSIADKVATTAEELWIGYADQAAVYERYIGKVSYSCSDTDPGWLT